LLPEKEEFRRTFRDDANDFIDEDEFRVKNYNIEIDACAHSPSTHHSGVTIVGLFDGIPILRRIEESKWLCEYNLVAELGGASEKFRKRNDKLLTTANVSHVTREQILRATSYFDAKHRHDLVNNVLKNTTLQQAYDFLSRGLPRQVGLERDEKFGPLAKIYNIELKEFAPPQFKLLVHTIDASPNDLNAICPQIAYKVRSLANNKIVRLAKFGPIDSKMCLAEPQWQLDSILQNQQQMLQEIDEDCLFTPPTIDSLDKKFRKNIYTQQNAKTLDFSVKNAVNF